MIDELLLSRDDLSAYRTTESEGRRPGLGEVRAAYVRSQSINAFKCSTTGDDGTQVWLNVTMTTLAVTLEFVVSFKGSTAVSTDELTRAVHILYMLSESIFEWEGTVTLVA